jgi:predicted RNA-binding Zn-ribbon protein involved in translation (DUF1610 family)
MTTYELCPECEKEVQLKAALSIQVCPNCGKIELYIEPEKLK